MPHELATDELDLLEAGRLLGLGRKRLIKWSKAELLPHRRDGFAWYFTREALLSFARKRCLECGQPHVAIAPGIYFCSACASAHALDDTDVEVTMFSRMDQQRTELLCMRLTSQNASEQDAIATLQTRHGFSALRAHQVWFAHAYQKEGTLRIGLGSIESPFEEEET